MLRNLPLPFGLNLRETKLLGVLLAFTLFCTALLVARVLLTDRITYIFLQWNLFLAWIPLGFAALANRVPAIRKRWWLVLPCFGVWLVFFPNAPYILTDLFHLRNLRGVPLWFDTLLILSFAINGLLLGFASLIEIRSTLRRFLSWFQTEALCIVFLVSSGYGIYIGRYLRWNSWDFLTHPRELLLDIFAPAFHPFQHKETIAMTVLFGGFMVLTYWAVMWLSEPQRNTETAVK